MKIMNETRSNEIYDNYFDNSFIDSIFNQYLIGLGQFKLENYELGRKDWFIWIMFIFMTFLTQIVFLNMLIAIMGNTYAKETETKDQSALKAQVDLISDYVVITKREKTVNAELAKYIFAITPTNLSTDEDDDWDGSVSTIKEAIADSSIQVMQVMQKRIDLLSREITTASKTMTHLDEKVSDLQANQERLNNKLDQKIEPIIPAIEKLEEKINTLLNSG